MWCGVCVCVCVYVCVGVVCVHVCTVHNLMVVRSGQYVPCAKYMSVYYVHNHALLGHPIGATGLGQCAELIWQVLSVYIRIENSSKVHSQESVND